MRIGLKNGTKLKKKDECAFKLISLQPVIEWLFSGQPEGKVCRFILSKLYL